MFFYLVDALPALGGVGRWRASRVRMGVLLLSFSYSKMWMGRRMCCNVVCTESRRSDRPGARKLELQHGLQRHVPPGMTLRSGWQLLCAFGVCLSLRPPRGAQIAHLLLLRSSDT